jgi:amidohydrolase
MMSNINFMVEAQTLRDEIVALRRDFHQHPELAFEEVRTAGIVAQTLNDLGLEVQTGIGKTGVVAILEGNRPGPTVLVRADMDALPILETNKTDYVSVEQGKMHACGHDGHTAIALGVAKLFSKHRDQLKGRIKFVFQPAEEIAGGAKAMREDGVLESPRPDVTLGLHLWNTMPVGILGVADGPVMAGCGDLNIKILGKGGHGAVPDLAIDPMVCAAQIITALQTIVSRNLDPIDTAVVSVTQINAGTATNIIPESVTMAGTFRFFKQEVAELLMRRIREIVNGIATAMNCTAEVELRLLTEPVSNNLEVANRVRNAFVTMGQNVDNFRYERTMGAEDVGVFMNDIPGMYFFVGSGNEERDLAYPHHHPRFDFDEDALPLSVALLSAAVAEYVLGE